MNKIIKIIKDNIKIFFIIVFLIIIIFLILIFYNKNKTNTIENNIKINLFGSSNITLSYGEEYIEPGYYAYNDLGEIITDLVVVSNNVDVYKPGIYKITYQIDDIIIERIVEVLEKEISNITFNLIGEDEITLSLNSEYKELGFIALNNNYNLDLSDKVNISGSVDTSLEGTYVITYSLNYEGVLKELTRTIKVINKNLKIAVDYKDDYTNSNLTVSVVVIGDNFSYVLLPNNVISYKNITEYKISKNGTYKFIAYNQDGDEFSKTITINNIDKEAPNGTCTATLYYNSTNISVSATDNLSKVKNYIYYNNSSEIKTSNSSFLTYNEKLSKNINVKLYDNAGNFKMITCSVSDKSFLEPIKPSSSSKIVFKEETDTLKVYITKKSTYYITQFWMYDPYNQLNKFDSPEYGTNLYRPKVLLEKAISKYSLSNKLVVGFNASGFYLDGVWGTSTVKKYSKYNKTSSGSIVITNGIVIRNWYDKAYVTNYITGVDKDYNLRIFTDSPASTTEEIAKKKISNQEIIDSGIRNTYTFKSPLVTNGVASSITTGFPSVSSKLNRQAICQVNRNNFVLITGESLNRNDLINIMLSLNCQTGTNLDGGGSIALLYKSRSSTSIKTVIGNERNLPEVGYFTELY